jgi:hypothetical protein
MFIIRILYAPISKYVSVPCSNCSVDLSTTTDCNTNLDKWKDNKEFVDRANSLGISVNNIQKTTKAVLSTNNGASVQCRYYGEPRSIIGK